MIITKNIYLFRFLFIFFSLVFLPFPLDKIPLLDSSLAEWFNNGIECFIVFVGNDILKFEEEITRGMRGDSLMDWLGVAIFLVIAIFGSLIWSFFDKKKQVSLNLNYVLWVYLRYYLAITMIIYGLVKLFPLQFIEPSIGVLMSKVGDLSPMGIAWTFMGASQGYVHFIGLGEIIGGLLLLHKRTTLLGGLILFVILMNVFAFNVFYDVSVKLYSFLYLITSLVIIAPQLPKIFNVMFGSRSIEPYKFYNLIKNAKWIVYKDIFKWSLIILIIGNIVYQDYDVCRKYIWSSPHPLKGFYKVDELIINGTSSPALLKDTLRLGYMDLQYKNQVLLYNLENHEVHFIDGIEIDTTTKVFKNIEPINTNNKRFEFSYIKNNDELIMNGVMDKDSIYCKFKKVTNKDFNLLNGKYNWLQK